MSWDLDLLRAESPGDETTAVIVSNLEVRFEYWFAGTTLASTIDLDDEFADADDETIIDVVEATYGAIIYDIAATLVRQQGSFADLRFTLPTTPPPRRRD